MIGTVIIFDELPNLSLILLKYLDNSNNGLPYNPNDLKC